MRKVKLDISQRDYLPIGSSNFEILRADQALYVDKTALIYKLAKDQGYYFLSRPRRFGKSLLISTFESLFKNGIKDFKGLAIEKKWQDHTYPVVHLVFSSCSYFQTIEKFKKDFLCMLRDAVTAANLEFPPHKI